MKPALSLSIPSPCAEKWNNFTPAANGGFCGSCAKIVIDFTRMSDADVIEYFKKKEAHTCGRFRAGQLKDYSALPAARINPGFTLLKAGFVSLLLLLVSKQSSAQTITEKAKTETVHHKKGLVSQSNDARLLDQLVKGVVKSSEDEVPLPGVNVALKGSSVGVVSDAEGHFEFPKRLKEGDVLVFSFIGLNTKEYSVPKVSDANAAINMSLTMCDMVIMGEVAADGIYTEPVTDLRKLWSKVKNLF